MLPYGNWGEMSLAGAALAKNTKNAIYIKIPHSFSALFKENQLSFLYEENNTHYRGHHRNTWYRRVLSQRKQNGEFR